jgi:hypothetical protein
VKSFADGPGVGWSQKIKAAQELAAVALPVSAQHSATARADACQAALEATYPPCYFSGCNDHKVGRCRLTVSKPELKAHLVSEYSLETKM